MHVTFPQDLEMLKSVCGALLEQWRGSETFLDSGVSEQGKGEK